MNLYEPKSEQEKNIFARFKKEVLKIRPVHHRGFNNYFIRRNFLYMGYIVMVLFIVNLGETIHLLVSDDIQYFNKLFLIITSAIFCTFCVAIAICQVKARQIRTWVLRLISNIFYFALITESTILLVAANIIAEKNGISSDYVGFSIATFYLATLVFMPLPHKGDMFFMFGLIALSFVVPLFVQGHTSYNIIYNAFIRIFVIGAYLSFIQLQKSSYKKSEELNATNDSLILTANKDPLVFALNRFALDEYWKSMLDNDAIEKIGVIIFDIDNFKSFNDNYSHLMGDKVLQSICKIVTDYLISKGLYFFRYGGEEFVIILENCTDEELLKTGVDIKNTVYEANLSRMDNPNYDRVTITVGCAILTKLEMVHGDFISKADKALYTGKNGTKNCVVFKDKFYY